VSRLTLPLISSLSFLDGTASWVYVTVGRLSIRSSHHSLAERRCGVCCCGPGGAGYIDRLLHGRRSAVATPQHGAQQQMWAVPRYQLT